MNNLNIEEMFKETTVWNTSGGRRRYYGQEKWYRVYWDLMHPDQPCEGYDIHHIDFNELNDDISNLELLTRSEHVRLHNLNMSDETRKKMSVNNTGANNPQARAVNINGQIFSTGREAAKYLNISPVEVYRRLKSNKSGYSYS